MHMRAWGHCVPAALIPHCPQGKGTPPRGAQDVRGEVARGVQPELHTVPGTRWHRNHPPCDSPAQRGGWKAWGEVF